MCVSGVGGVGGRPWLEGGAPGLASALVRMSP